MIFKLSKEQVKKFEKWKKTLPKIKDGDFGAAGGAYWIKFTPTGIGMIVEAGRYDLLETIELTDYENW